MNSKIEKPEESQVDSCIQILSVEVLRKIFGFLSIKDWKNLRLVCYFWFHVVNAKLKLKIVLSNETKRWIQRYGNYELDSLSIENFTNKISHLSCSIIVPSARKYILGIGNSTDNITCFLRCFSQDIQSLCIQNLSLAYPKTTQVFQATDFFKDMKWKCLSSLLVTLGSKGTFEKQSKEYQNHIEAVTLILNSIHIERLKCFAICLDYGDDTYFKKPWTEIFGFLLRHQNYLKIFKINMCGKPIPPLLAEMHFRDLNLSSLSVGLDVTHACFANSLCTGVNGLKHLKIQHVCHTSQVFPMDRNFKMHDILRSSAETLETLNCQSVSFQLFWLRSFTMLRVLTVQTAYIGYRIANLELPSLVRFHLFADFGLGQAGLNNSLTNDMVTHVSNGMPNIEDLELVIPCQHFAFNWLHLEILWAMKKLRTIVLGVNAPFLEFQEFSAPIPNINVRRISLDKKSTVSRYKGPFICTEIKILR